MRIEDDVKLDFQDVLLRPKRSTLNSRAEVSLVRKIAFKNSGRSWEGIPIMASNLDIVGTFAMANALKKHRMFTCIHKYYSIADWKGFLKADKDSEGLPFFAVSSGISEDDFNFLSQLLKEFPHIEFICINVANGYFQNLLDFIKKVRDTFPGKTIISGNVVTGEMTEEIILSGADIVKVGIGKQSSASIIHKTGVGYPQLSAIVECADAAHGMGGHIVSDGGITCPGDIAKAYGAGADFIMLAGMFAGHDETGGDIVTDKDNPHKKFRIFNASDAVRKGEDADDRYGASYGSNILVKYKGPVFATVEEIKDGLRSACAYVGAFSVKELPKRASFIRVNSGNKNNSRHYFYEDR